MANQYFTCALDAWADGATIHARMHYYRSDGLSYTYQDGSFPTPTMTIAGTSYSDTDFANRVHNGLSIGSVYTTEFTKTVSSNGNYNVSFTAGSGGRSDFAGTWSTSVSVTGAATAPAVPSVTIAEVYDTGAKFNVSISSYGNPSSANGRWIEAGIAGQNAWGPYLRSTKALNTSSAVITVNNYSTQTQSLTIQPNTQYYYGGYSYNTQLSDAAILGQLVTKASAPEITPGTITADSATFFYSASADGGYYDKTIQYSIDNGTTWVTVATISGGSATTGDFTISSLTADTRYTLQTRVSTTAGETTGESITFITRSGLINAFYGSASSQSVRTDTIYGSVNSQSKAVEKLYGSVETPTSTIIGVEGEVRPGGEGNVTGFNGATFWAKAHTQINPSKTPSFLWIKVRDQYGSIFFDIAYTDNSYDRLLDQTHTLAELAEYGITASYVGEGEDYIDLTPIYATEPKTKLIHQSFGHINYGYGIVTYYTDSGHTTTDSVFIANQTEFSQLRSLTSDSWNATIGGHTIPNTDILGLILTSKVTTIPAGFLRGCTAFNSDLALPSTITAIGSSSGADFMRGCTNMVSTVNFGSLPTSIVSTTDSNSFTTGTNGTAPAYTSGIKIAGSNRSAWLSLYPNSSHTPYRKLVDAGY